MRKNLSVLLIFAFLAGCSPQTPAPLLPPTPVPTARPGVLYVDPGQSLGPISPLVYGSNYGPWTSVPAGKLEDAEASAVTVIRFPGGEWGDRNNLQPYQIDQFMAFCKRLNASATINVRTMNGTPEAAAELVRYVNIENKYGVRYWAIGNEPQFYEAALREPYSVERFNQDFRALAEAMKAVDPGIQIIGPELTNFGPEPEKNPKDSTGKDWMVEFLRANGDIVDVVSIHRYPFPVSDYDPSPTIDDLRQDAPKWDATLMYLRDLVHQETGRDIPIAVTETNSNWTKISSGEATPDSFYNAIWWADSLGQMIRQRVLLVNHWLLADAGATGAWGIVGRDKPRPTYYVYQVYKHFGDELLYSASGVADVSIYAAKRKDGALTLVVINLSDKEQRVSLELEGGAPPAASVILLDISHNAEDLGKQPFLVDGRLSLPPQSVTLYVLD
jgi:hypothetical protein